MVITEAGWKEGQFLQEAFLSDSLLSYILIDESVSLWATDRHLLKIEVAIVIGLSFSLIRVLCRR